MRRFSFSLQKVLQLRKYREDQCKIELGQAIGILSEIENRIRERAFHRHQAASERFTGTAVDMQAWDHYIARLDQEVQRLTEDAARAELVVEEKRENYLEASRELKVIEKLKEKREKEHRKDMFDAQTAELDDLWRRQTP